MQVVRVQRASRSCAKGLQKAARSLGVSLAGSIAILLLAGGQAAAQEGISTFEEAKLRLKHEPAVDETLRQALKYFRVDPENFDRLRRTANSRAWLPTFAAGYRMDDTGTERRQFTSSNPFLQEGVGTRVNTVSIGAVWDLRELVFNPAQVQVYGLIGVQRDLMLETTRVYYLRKQLFVRFLNAPPEDPLAREALMLRVSEFTSLLDVLTGGWFSRETTERLRRSGDTTRSGAGARSPEEDVRPSIQKMPKGGRRPW